MPVKKDERTVKSKKNPEKTVKKITYKCEGSYVDADGKQRRYHKRGFESKSDAETWEMNFKLKAKYEISNSLSFNELYEIYKDSKIGKIKDRSLNDMNYLANEWVLPFWGKIPTKLITIKKIEKYQNFLLMSKKKDESYFSNRYLESIQTLFKAVLRYGINYGYLSDSRLLSFPIAKRAGERRKEMCFFTPEEYVKFIQEVDETEYYALFNVLYWCGTRLGETLALTWNDINFENKVLKINKSYSKHTHQTTAPKTENSYRDILIPEMCIHALEKLKTSQSKIIGFNNEMLIFYFDKHLDENAIRTRKNRWCELAKIKQIRIHDFRHSHVSLLINMGFNAFDIAKRMGHTVEMVNETYGHWFHEAQLNMVNKLNELSMKLIKDTPNLHQIYTKS